MHVYPVFAVNYILQGPMRCYVLPELYHKFFCKDCKKWMNVACWSDAHSYEFGHPAAGLLELSDDKSRKVDQETPNSADDFTKSSASN